jgi:hypothetical protein
MVFGKNIFVSPIKKIKVGTQKMLVPCCIVDLPDNDDVSNSKNTETRITQPKTHGKHQHKIRIPRTLSLTIEMGEAKPSVAAEPGGSNMGVGKVGKDSGH